MKSFKFKDEDGQIIIINLLDDFGIEVWGNHVYRGFLTNKKIIWNNNQIFDQKDLRAINRFINTLVFS